MSETCDALGGFLIYSSFSGSMGTFGVDYMERDYKKCPQTFISHFPDQNSPNSIASSMEIYNFPHHISKIKN